MSSSFTANRETEFEKRRGISAVEIREGYAQVQFASLPDPLAASRLEVLRTMSEAGISLDFLKLTQGGLGFLIPESLTERAQSAQKGLIGACEITKGRSIVLIHAVNMRDEEGLIARIVSTAIDCGVRIDHLGDMHDRLLLVTGAAEAEELAELIRSDMMGAIH